MGGRGKKKINPVQSYSSYFWVQQAPVVLFCFPAWTRNLCFWLWGWHYWDRSPKRVLLLEGLFLISSLKPQRGVIWPQLPLDESPTHSQSHAIAPSQPPVQGAQEAPKQPFAPGACTDMSTEGFPCVSMSPVLLTIQTRWILVSWTQACKSLQL